MSRLRATATILSLLAPALASGQSDAGLWRYVHPNAKAVVSIDWQRVRGSSVFAQLRQKMATAGPLPLPITSFKFPGMELLNDIDRVLISTPGPSAPAAPPDGAVEPAKAHVDQVLFVIHGHFDLAKVKQVLSQYGAKPQTFNSIAVYRPQGKGGENIAIVPLDAQTILIGDAKSVFASLERNKFPPPPPAAGSLLARVEEMDATYEAWLLMAAPDVLGSERLNAMLSGSDWGSDARGFEAGVSFKSGMLMDVVVRFASEASAQKMAADLGRLIKIAAKDHGAEPALQELSKKFKIVAEGMAAHMSLRLTPEEVAKSVQMMQASMAKGEAAAAQNPPHIEIRPVITPAPVPSRPATIRIEGLDDGPREVPYHEH